jgi:hypothetical protein
MTKREQIAVGALAGFVQVIILLFVTVFWLETRARISAENAERIKPGMTMAEVQDILGPPLIYPLKDHALLHRPKRAGWPQPPRSATVAYWRRGDQKNWRVESPTTSTIVVVGFDASERVLRVESRTTDKSPVDKPFE